MPATSPAVITRVRRSLVNGWVAAVATVAGVLIASGVGANDTTEAIPAFRPGERLTFVLKWTIIPAGEAVLEVRPRPWVAGRQANHFVLTARSNAFIDAFYMVRDRIDAWADTAMANSLRYRKKQHEGATRRDITVTFDWEAMTAQYTNRGKAQTPIAITRGTFDPLAVFYWCRSETFSVGTKLLRPVTDGKKHVIGIADVVRRETIRVPAGTFDTFLIEPDLAHVGGVFEKSPDARIQVWVTADQRHLPVKLKSKVIVGSFSGELVRMVGVGPRSEASVNAQ